LLGEKPASGAVRLVDGDNDSLKTYFMPAVVQLQQWARSRS